MARFRYLDAAQWWPPERVLAARDAMLTNVVRTAAAEVDLYRDLYAGAGIDANDVRNAGDLSALPIVAKADLRAGYPDRTTRPTGQRTYDECTSGSTGEPLCVKEDSATAGWYRASFLQILSWAGWSLGQRHLQLGVNPLRQRGRAMKDRVLRCSYVSIFQLGRGGLDRALGQLVNRHIRYVFGYPMDVQRLARRSLELGWSVSLDGVVTWGDPLGASGRTAIEETFGCRVLDAYGLAEGLWIASQCPRRDLYHVHSLDAVLELVDDVGRPVEAGTAGHVVVTRLHAGPSPLIRYRTGDLAVRTTASCGCGRGYETISSIVGRTVDTLVTPSGKRLIVEFFSGMFDDHPDISAFQAAKTHADRLELRIVLRDHRRIATVDEVARRIKEQVPDMSVEIRIVDQVPLTRAGKRRFVIDETSREAV
jgi:phenylacetate-CoA ligase